MNESWPSTQPLKCALCGEEFDRRSAIIVWDANDLQEVVCSRACERTWETLPKHPDTDEPEPEDYDDAS